MWIGILKTLPISRCQENTRPASDLRGGPVRVNMYCWHSVHLMIAYSGFNISTSLLAPASEFLKKWILGKYIFVSTCPNGQADFLSTARYLYRKMTQIPRNRLKMQQNLIENGFKVIKYSRNNTCHSSICYNLLRASKTLWQAINNP